MNSIVNVMYVGSQIRVPLVVPHSDDSDMVEDWVLSEGTIIGIDTEHGHVAIMFNMSSCEDHDEDSEVCLRYTMGGALVWNKKQIKSRIIEGSWNETFQKW